jgi:hypothetical protein
LQKSAKAAISPRIAAAIARISDAYACFSAEERGAEHRLQRACLADEWMGAAVPAFPERQPWSRGRLGLCSRAGRGRGLSPPDPVQASGRGARPARLGPTVRPAAETVAGNHTGQSGRPGDEPSAAARQQLRWEVPRRRQSARADLLPRPQQRDG